MLQFVELLERQRVDGSEQTQLAVELAHPTGGGSAIGKIGHLGRLGDLRFDVELATQRLDRRLEAELRFGLLDLGPVRPLTGLLEVLLRLDPALAGLVERRGEPPNLLTLTTATLRQVVVLDLDHATVGLDQRRESVDGDDRSLDDDPTFGGERTRLLIGLETAFGLSDARLEELLPLAQTSVADLELATARREHGGTRLQLGTSFAPRSCGFGFGVLVGIERRQRRLELGHSLTLALDVRRELRNRTIEPLELGFELATLPQSPGKALGRGGEPAVVLIELTYESGFMVAGVHVALARLGKCHLGRRETRRSVGRTVLGIDERGRRGAARRRADPPASGSEAIAARSHDHRCRVGQRCLDRAVERIDPDRRADEGIEQPRHAGAPGTDVRSHRFTDRRHADVIGPDPRRQHRTARFGLP